MPRKHVLRAGMILVLALGLILPMFSSRSQAAMTPADTVIGNAATAIYRDQSNNDYTTTSNIVQSVVLEVCGLDVSPSGPTPLRATPGQSIYVPIIVTNMGNGLNTFNLATGGLGTYSKSIYLDANGNGVVDPAESAGIASVTLNMGASANIIVGITVPPAAAPGDTDVSNITATGTAPAGCSDTSGDFTVTVVNDAVITVSKAVDKNTALPGETLTYSFRFKNVGSKPVYSRAGVNGYDIDAATVDGVMLYDQLPSGASYVAASASGTPAANPNGYPIYSANGTNWFTAEGAVVGTITYVAYFMPDGTPGNGTSETVLDVDQQGTFTYQVTVNSPFAEADGEINNTAAFYYNTFTATLQTVFTNEVITTIPANATSDIAVSHRVVDPYTNVEEDAALNYQNDNTAALVPAGSWVEFTHSLANRDAINSDLIDLSAINVPAGWLVEFWNANGTAKLIDTDGSGNVDLGTIAPQTRVDFMVKAWVPAAASGGPYFFDIQATSGNKPAEIDLSRDNVTAVLSVDVDIAQYADAGDATDEPSDGDTNGANDADDILAAETSAVLPGSTASYRLQVVNIGGSSDSYALNVSGNPAGTVAKFYSDLNNDGDHADAGEAEITDTPLLGGTVVRVAGVFGGGNTTFTVYGVANFVAGDVIRLNKTVTATILSVDAVNKTITVAGDQTANTDAGDLVSESYSVIMEVATTPTTPPSVNNLVVAAISNTSGTVDNMDVYFEVLEVCSVAVNPNSSDQIPATGTTTYIHTVTNSGNSTKYVKIDLNMAGLGLTYLFLAEGANWKAFGVDGLAGTGDDVALADGDTAAVGTVFIQLAAGASANFKIKVFAPAGTAPGLVESANIQAVASSDGDFTTLGDQCSDTASETTTVIEGFLQVTKARTHLDVAYIGVIPSPGDEIVYSLTYKNIGQQTAVACVITDQIPDHTTYVAGSLYIDVNCDGLIDGGDTLLTDGSGDDTAEYDGVNNMVRFRVGAGADAANGGSLAPGAQGCVLFKVLIQ
ncbi:MAG: hypothetical protein HZB23_14090 [Deltaproteobacteria bacterium]|nr:hypothetical protein [Deltaproteobacteria bacterium]